MQHYLVLGDIRFSNSEIFRMIANYLLLEKLFEIQTVDIYADIRFSEVTYFRIRYDNIIFRHSVVHSKKSIYNIVLCKNITRL